MICNAKPAQAMKSACEGQCLPADLADHWIGGVCWQELGLQEQLGEVAQRAPFLMVKVLLDWALMPLGSPPQLEPLQTKHS